MIISVSGKIGSGKDTVGKIIQIITDNPQLTNEAVEKWIPRQLYPGKFETRKWADSLKDIVCILIGCTREQLEDHEFKNTPLGEEWIRYSYADGFYKNYFYKNGEETMTTVMNAVPCSKERYEEELRVNWQTAYKVHYTPRLLLQHIGTELMRNQILNNIWVNSLMSKYPKIGTASVIRKKGKALQGFGNKWKIPETDDIPLRLRGKFINSEDFEYDDVNIITPNWIITDTRFPNELKAVKDRNGISIRVKRTYSKEPIYIKGEECSGTSRQDWEDAQPVHPSETALDNATFDYEIINNGSMIKLIEKVREILTKENLI